MELPVGFVQFRGRERRARLGAGSPRAFVLRRAFRELVAWTICRSKRPPGGGARRKAARSSVNRRECGASRRGRRPLRRRIAPEIAFLAGQGLARAALLQGGGGGASATACRRASPARRRPSRRGGLLSRAGAPSAVAVLPRRDSGRPIGRGGSRDRYGVAPLAPNRAGLRVIAAPRAAAIRYLLGKAEAARCRPA